MIRYDRCWKVSHTENVITVSFILIATDKIVYISTLNFTVLIKLSIWIYLKTNSWCALEEFVNLTHGANMLVLLSLHEC